MRTRFQVLIGVFGLLCGDVMTAQPTEIPEDTVFRNRVEQRIKSHVFKILADAQVIAIYRPSERKDQVVCEVLRGEAKVGEFWNSSIFPSQPILVYQKFPVGDLGHGVMSSTGDFLLNERGDVLLPEGEGEGLVIPLKDLHTMLDSMGGNSLPEPGLRR